MKVAGMVRPECPIQRPTDLRSVRINFIDFQGRLRRGQLIVNADVASSVVRVFSRLFEAKFPIRDMRPLERFGGDSHASLRADNTSAYNCRRANQINAPFRRSPHANGRAIDVNPRENPWMDLRCKCWFPSRKLAAREPGPGAILRNGLVWRAFKAEGWVWQDIDVPDYMHFDTGYPSRPFRLGLTGTGWKTRASQAMLTSIANTIPSTPSLRRTKDELCPSLADESRVEIEAAGQKTAQLEVGARDQAGPAGGAR